MKTIAVAALAFALIPFKEGQLSYSLENVYLLETAIIGTGGFLLSLEPTKAPIRGKFGRNVLVKAIPSGLLVWLGAMIPVFLHQGGVITSDVMKSMISVMTALSGLTVVIAMTIPFNRFRTIMVCLVIGNVALFALALPRVFVGAEALNFSADSIRMLFHEMFQPWNSPAVTRLFVTPEGTFNAWATLTMVIFVAVMIPSYYCVVRLITKWLDKRNALDEAKAIENKQ